jgi:hypothetical protein
VAGNSEGGVVRFQQGGIACLVQHEGKWIVNWVMAPDLLGGENKP